MECREVQEKILESLEEGGLAEGRRAIDAHLAGCAACAGFALRQQAVDARLGRMLVPPEMSPGFRAALLQRIRRATVHVWADSLPDKVHFLSCGLATVLSAVFMPFAASTVLGAGAAATIAAYILMIEVRFAFEGSEDRGQ